MDIVLWYEGGLKRERMFRIGWMARTMRGAMTWGEDMKKEVKETLTSLNLLIRTLDRMPI